MVNHGAACMFKEKEAHHEKVTMTIQTLLIDEDRLAQMSKASFQLGKPNATRNIVDEAIGLIK
jgi:UDP-N-acetylglucosamine:LPS N-acetylglucosamine transferase